MATMIVRERSGAEIPVVMPWRASMASVNAVALGVSLRLTIGFSPSCSQRSSVSERQISPRPWVAMKLIASGVANWAAMTRSPSFSRSSESRITTMRPARISSIASATEANWAVLIVIRRPSTGTAPRDSTYFATTSTSRLTGRPTAWGPRVVTAIVWGISAIVKASPRRGHGQADAVDDAALLHDVAQQGRRRGDLEQRAVALGPGRANRSHAVDVPLHEVAVESGPEAHRPLEVDAVPGARPPSVVRRRVSATGRRRSRPPSPRSR